MLKTAYISQFILEDGDIVLAISDKSVVILYVDKVGETIHQKENNENALNDLLLIRAVIPMALYLLGCS